MSAGLKRLDLKGEFQTADGGPVGIPDAGLKSLFGNPNGVTSCGGASAQAGDPVATGRLGLVHGVVGTLLQGGQIGQAIRAVGHADAGRDLQ